MADYVNQQFECFIPRKDVDVEVNLLMLKPVPENVRGVKKLNDFLKSVMGHRILISNEDTTMEKSKKN